MTSELIPRSLRPLVRAHRLPITLATLLVVSISLIDPASANPCWRYYKKYKDPSENYESSCMDRATAESQLGTTYQQCMATDAFWASDFICKHNPISQGVKCTSECAGGDGVNFDQAYVETAELLYREVKGRITGVANSFLKYWAQEGPLESLKPVLRSRLLQFGRQLATLDTKLSKLRQKLDITKHLRDDLASEIDALIEDIKKSQRGVDDSLGELVSNRETRKIGRWIQQHQNDPLPSGFNATARFRDLNRWIDEQQRSVDQAANAPGPTGTADGTCDGYQLLPGERCCRDKDDPDFTMVCARGAVCPPMPNMTCN